MSEDQLTNTARGQRIWRGRFIDDSAAERNGVVDSEHPCDEILHAGGLDGPHALGLLAVDGDGHVAVAVGDCAACVVGVGVNGCAPCRLVDIVSTSKLKKKRGVLVYTCDIHVTISVFNDMLNTFLLLYWHWTCG